MSKYPQTWEYWNGYSVTSVGPREHKLIAPDGTVVGTATDPGRELNNLFMQNSYRHSRRLREPMTEL